MCERPSTGALTGDGHEHLQIVVSERGAVAPRTRLIFEWPGEGRCEERSLLAAILPDRGLDVVTSQRRRRSFGWVVGRDGVSTSC